MRKPNIRRIRNVDAQKFIDMAKRARRQDREIALMDLSFEYDINDIDRQLDYAIANEKEPPKRDS